MDEQRKCVVARKLESNYTSLPGIVCDDFFNRYANCVFVNSNNRKRQKQQIVEDNKGKTKLAKQVKVCCQISELDESRSGGKLIRRKLTQLKEEEYDNEEGEGEGEEDEDDGEEENTEEEEEADMIENGNRNRFVGENSCDEKGSLGYNHHDTVLARKATTTTKKKENEDFGVFLRCQISASDKSGKMRKQVNVYQKSLPSLSKSATTRSQRHLSNNSATNSGKTSNKLKCFELFCVHQASLLVHRDQVLIEAKRLAERLASLTSNEEQQ